ncbi:hypothetical protein ACN47E_008651 [Coniothyrium glycines]
MAATRPNIRVVPNPGGNTFYQCLDSVDEQEYGSLRYQYERAAFLDMIQEWLQAPAATRVLLPNGAAVRTLWHQSRARRSKKRKTHHMQPKPYATPDPPLIATVTQPVPRIGPLLNFSAVTNVQITPQGPPGAALQTSAAAQVTDEQQSGDADDHHIDSDDSDIGGQRSPPFILQNRVQTRDYLRPSNADRRRVLRQDGGPWMFAGILYQTNLAQQPKNATCPHKSVSLYVRPDSNRIIRDQLVDKCIAQNDSDIAVVEHEIRINELLDAVGCDHIIKYRGHKAAATSRSTPLSPEDNPVLGQNLWHLYSDYAPYGDLSNIIRGHCKARKLVPEHFIWYFLSQMAQALSAFESGICETSITGNLKQGWKPLVHSDIKSENIFLCANNTSYPAYPKVVLSDFDHVVDEGALNTDDDQRWNRGTVGWQAPERYSRMAQAKAEDYEPKTWLATRKADIWSVGLAAWNLMQAHKKSYSTLEADMSGMCQGWVAGDPNFSPANIASNHSTVPSDLKHLPEEYSVALCHMVQRCLTNHPDYRPMVDELYTTAQAQLARLDALYGNQLQKDKNAVIEPLKLELGDQAHFSTEFAIGQEYKNHGKRRKVQHVADKSESFKYDKLVSTWNDIPPSTLSAQSTALAQEAVMKTLHDIVMKNDMNLEEMKDKDEIEEKEYYEPVGIASHTVCLLSWKYLYSSILKRINPSARVYVQKRLSSKNSEAEAFTAKFKRVVLKKLGKYIEKRLEGSELTDDQREALPALINAINWGQRLLVIDAEPESPALMEKTAFHRGVADFVLLDLDGVFYHDEALAAPSSE